jgi:hypothetical protein
MTTPAAGHTGPGTLQAADAPPGQNILSQARARHPRWGIWISSAGRYWATRQGSARLTKAVHPGWAMTVDADSLTELETRIQAQKDYEQAPVLSSGESRDSA